MNEHVTVAYHNVKTGQKIDIEVKEKADKSDGKHAIVSVTFSPKINRDSEDDMYNIGTGIINLIREMK